MTVSKSEFAIRIVPSPQSRACAINYASDAPDRWHAQLIAYQVMPTDELLTAREVQLTVLLQALISQHGRRAACAECGEDIINEREVRREGKMLCRACASGAYYQIAQEALVLPAELCKMPVP
jgi:formylmethanofuran dehydrogenase subunit E